MKPHHWGSLDLISVSRDILLPVVEYFSHNPTSSPLHQWIFLGKYKLDKYSVCTMLALLGLQYIVKEIFLKLKSSAIKCWMTKTAIYLVQLSVWDCWRGFSLYYVWTTICKTIQITRLNLSALRLWYNNWRKHIWIYRIFSV